MKKVRDQRGGPPNPAVRPWIYSAGPTLHCCSFPGPTKMVPLLLRMEMVPLIDLLKSQLKETWWKIFLFPPGHQSFNPWWGGQWKGAGLHSSHLDSSTRRTHSGLDPSTPSPADDRADARPTAYSFRSAAARARHGWLGRSSGRELSSF
jgi:hypothetical protein